MITEIDCILAGLLGGGIGCALVFSTMYIHFHLKFKDYFYNKEHFKTRMLVTELTDKVNGLGVQIGALNAEIYHRATEDMYK